METFNLYGQIAAEEEVSGPVDLKASLVLLFDNYIQHHAGLTAEQKAELAQLRGKTITTLTHF